MGDILIAIMGFMGTYYGLGKLSSMHITLQPNVTGVMVSYALQTSGSTMAVVSSINGEYATPVVLFLIAMIIWAFSDRRSTNREVLS